MARDQKRRLMNKLAKRSGVGMKWKKKRGTQQEWSERMNNLKSDKNG
jgi:hypothetical protein